MLRRDHLKLIKEREYMKNVYNYIKQIMTNNKNGWVFFKYCMEFMILLVVVS